MRAIDVRLLHTTGSKGFLLREAVYKSKEGRYFEAEKGKVDELAQSEKACRSDSTYW